MARKQPEYPHTHRQIPWPDSDTGQTFYGADFPITTGEILSRVRRPDFGGEAICSLDKAVDYARRGLAGIVAVCPFNCEPR
jgi:hypothetical protein